jgi:hypothetical protein
MMRTFRSDEGHNMDKYECLKRSIEYLIDTIDYEVWEIEDDCKNEGGPMGAVSYTKLKVYKEVRDVLSDSIEEAEGQSMGKVVITTKEDRIIEGCFRNLKKVEVTTDYIIWTFKNEDSAIHGAKVLMNCNFEYVKRI